MISGIGAWLLAGVLVLHGIAHLVGFLRPWRLVEMTELPYGTTVLGGKVDLGDRGIRIVGLLWLVVAIAFVAAALGLLTAAPWWRGVALGTVAASLVLEALEWPTTRLGIVANILILVVLLLDARMGWFAPG